MSCEMDETGSGSCALVDFGIGSVESLGSRAVIVLKCVRLIVYCVVIYASRCGLLTWRRKRWKHQFWNFCFAPSDRL